MLNEDFFHPRNFYKWPGFWGLIVGGVILLFGLLTGQL